MIRSMFVGKYTKDDGLLDSQKNAVNQCRDYIRTHNSILDGKAGKALEDAIRLLISSFVDECKPVIDGFVNEDGTVNTKRIAMTLYQEINEYGPATEAINTDPAISGITDLYCEGVGPGNLYVLRGKRKSLLYDANGNMLYFKDPDEIFQVINKLLFYSKQRLTIKAPIVYANTVQGYRLTAQDASISADIIRPDEQKIKVPSFSIRFPAGKALTFDDMIYKFKTISPSMGKVLTGIAKIDRLKAGFFGVPGSGKTTLMSEVAKTASTQAAADKTSLFRIKTIERTPELKLWVYDENGEALNSVNSTVALMDTSDESDMSVPTPTNLFYITLREKIDMIVLGEIRSTSEIRVLREAVISGQGVMFTMHAGSDEEAAERLIKNIKQMDNCSRSDAVEELALSIDLVICMEANLIDKKIRPYQISELLKTETDTGAKLKINPVFDFHVTDKRIGENGQISGYYRKIGNFSRSIRRRIEFSLMSEEEKALLLQEVPDGGAIEYKEVW